MAVEQPSLLVRPSAPARRTDPGTSHAAARLPFRRGSQRHRLLLAYGAAWKAASGISEDLTDEQAARICGIIRGCPWKRCSELREDLLITPTGRTRESTMGADQQTCVITGKGLEVLASLDATS